MQIKRGTCFRKGERPRAPCCRKGSDGRTFRRKCAVHCTADIVVRILETASRRPLLSAANNVWPMPGEEQLAAGPFAGCVRARKEILGKHVSASALRSSAAFCAALSLTSLAVELLGVSVDGSVLLRFERLWFPEIDSGWHRAEMHLVNEDADAWVPAEVLPLRKPVGADGNLSISEAARGCTAGAVIVLSSARASSSSSS